MKESRKRMPPKRNDCLFAPPPIITSFYVADVGDNYAILQWFTTSVRQKYFFEIDYQIASDDSYDNDVSQKRVLPNSQKLVMLKDLKSSTNYTSSIFSYNNCGKSSVSNLTFETKTKILHPALTHVMPHEVILCLIVFLIWVIILRHFFVVYNRLAFVSPLSLGGYLTRKHDQPHHHHRSSAATSRTSSRHTLISKSSGIGTKFNLLETAVCTWRSETVLNGGNGIRRLSDNSVPYLIPSGKTSHYSNLSAGQSNSNRAASNNSLFTGTTRSSFSGPQIFLTTTSKPNSRRPSDSYQQILPPIVDDQSSYSYPPDMNNGCEGDDEISSSLQSATTVPIFEPLQNCSFDSDDTEILGIGVSGNSAAAATTRKVSEVLLGKATRDIRRCSSYSTNSESGEKKEPLKRRRTLLPYLSNLRNSMRKKKCQMEALKEEREATPVAADYQNWKNQMRKQKQESRALLSTPISMHPSLTTENSFESYVTASDVIIKIDSDDE